MYNQRSAYWDELYLGANGKLNVEYLVLCQDLAQNKMRSSVS